MIVMRFVAIQAIKNQLNDINWVNVKSWISVELANQWDLGLNFRSWTRNSIQKQNNRQFVIELAETLHRYEMEWVKLVDRLLS